MAFVDAPLQVEPTMADYEVLANLTMVWFEANIAVSLAPGVTFSRTEFTVQSTVFDAGYPESSYNVLIDYGLVQFLFLPSIDTVAEPPSGAEIDFILRNSVSKGYIETVVRMVNAFRGVTEAYYESLDNTFVPLPEEEP